MTKKQKTPKVRGIWLIALFFYRYCNNIVNCGHHHHVMKTWYHDSPKTKWPFKWINMFSYTKIVSLNSPYFQNSHSLFRFVLHQWIISPLNFKDLLMFSLSFLYLSIINFSIFMITTISKCISLYVLFSCRQVKTLRRCRGILLLRGSVTVRVMRKRRTWIWRRCPP